MSSAFHAPPTTQISTLSLHDALPICHVSYLFNERIGNCSGSRRCVPNTYNMSSNPSRKVLAVVDDREHFAGGRSEEHTSELQSHSDLVCRLLLEKKKTSNKIQLI